MRIERLGPDHRVAGFACGTKPLDGWLRHHALENQARNLSRAFVLVQDDEEVLGYYSLATGGVPPADLPPGYGRGLPGYDIGMALLARLAVASSRQGEGLGRDLMADAIQQAALAGAHVAARFVAVDLIDEGARAFYRKFGFRDVPGDPEGRMFLRLDHALEALEHRR